MHGYSTIAQLGSQPPNDWWWAPLTSPAGLVLLSLSLVCLLLIVFMLVRMRHIGSARRAAVTMRQRLAGDSGVAMVEFALVTPFLMFISLLLIQSMLVFTGLFYVQYAAFAGARSAIVQIPSVAQEPSNYIMPTRGSEKFDAIRT